MGRPILPPRHDNALFKKEVKRQLRQDTGSQLVVPVPFAASPYGGNGPPSSAWYIPVIAGSFGGTQPSQPWIVSLDRVFKLGFSILIPWTTDASTTGEVRLQCTPSPNSPSSAISLPAGSSGTVAFNWLLGIPPYTQYDVWVTIEARRVSGAGNVNIGYPLQASQVGPDGCTVSGL